MAEKRDAAATAEEQEHSSSSRATEAEKEDGAHKEIDGVGCVLCAYRL